MDNTHSLVASLKQMITSCQQIQDLLKNDKNLLANNDLATLENSNQKKTQLLNQLAMITQELKSQNHPNGLIESIKVTSQDLDSKVKKEIDELIATLQSEITHCYQSIMTNSRIVYTNIQFLKNLWDKLMDCKIDNACVYDHTGVKSK